MAMATMGALTQRFSVEPVASCSGRMQPGGHIVTNVRFPGRAAALSLRRKEGREGRVLICRAGGGEGKSCCGGGSSEGGSSSNGGKCSSHDNINSSADSEVDVSGIGKEFEALVAKKTMEEFESKYDSGQMVGNISRNVIEDVVNIYPDALSKKSEEKFLDIDEILAEARALSTSQEDFVFDADFEEMFV